MREHFACMLKNVKVSKLKPQGTVPMYIASDELTSAVMLYFCLCDYIEDVDIIVVFISDVLWQSADIRFHARNISA